MTRTSKKTGEEIKYFIAVYYCEDLSRYLNTKNNINVEIYGNIAAHAGPSRAPHSYLQASYSQISI